jgi:hypothetical protein
LFCVNSILRSAPAASNQQVQPRHFANVGRDLFAREKSLCGKVATISIDGSDGLRRRWDGLAAVWPPVNPRRARSMRP